MAASWSIEEVARMTGVTSRTLRHYDAIGLLPPAFTSDGGRRHYGQEELLRLQEILLLKQLGLGLDDVGAVLASRAEDDRIHVLRRHREQLVKEQERLARLVATVDRTIASLEEGKSMSPEEIFDGVIPNPYEKEARDEWGDAAVDRSYERIRRLPKADRERLITGAGWAQVHARIAELAHAGAAPDDPRVQAAVEEHIGLVRLAWEPNRAAYEGLADSYVSDERFARNIGDEATVKLLVAAMKVYAAANLT
ncbi:MAG TPA: MerR family transcriptional regulator [Trueperaceae bacterium]|nr:MerR family transcriptional regulator [Trueperaceae bacterium]